MKKIVYIVGARPQFIKLAPLIHQAAHVFNNVILHTGQHYDDEMSTSFFKDLDIPDPAYNLAIGSGSHGKQTALMLENIEKVLVQENPDAVVVFGDTNSTLAGALASTKIRILTAHVEACLRSHNTTMPEELNRICTDHVSDLLFVPTQNAMNNAQNEGLLSRSYLVGDIMVDSLALGMEKAKHKTDYRLYCPEGSVYYLLTLHRPYTVDNVNKLSILLEKLNKLPNPIVFPIHPRTRNILRHKDLDRLRNIRFINPLSYLDFIMLMKNCTMILTDSGGIQKEAYILRIPCLTLRPETEWVETVEKGWNTLVNPVSTDIANVILSYKIPRYHPALFGQDVSQKILTILKERI